MPPPTTRRRRTTPLRTRRAAAALLAVVAASAALGSGCSDDQAPAPADPDTGVEAALVVAGICPDAAPEAGEGCALPEGTTCAFGACATPIAACTRGAWRYATNPPPAASCAPEPPPAESACPPCWPAAVTCGYGTCSGPDASTNTAVAACPAGSWTLVVTPCDGGANVQGDAGGDAD
jgi:hypothetical protein